MVLTTTYFGSVAWYKQLACAKEPVYIEACENFVKQTERSRCRIMTANGVQTLTVPVSVSLLKEKTVEDGHSSDCGCGPCGNIRQVMISDHDNWRKVHWQALSSAYGNSPFFEFYADDIKPFFERNWGSLFDYNLDITKKMCELLDINPDIRLTEEFAHDALEGKRMVAPEGAYYQVFQTRHGFVPNLSVLDLLFNMGPESMLYLMK